MNEASRRQLASLVDGYPVEVSELSDGLLDRPDCTALAALEPGPALGLVQFGTWEEDEHHPGPLYLDLDPRRLRAGRLDVVFGRLHYGPVGRISETLSAWSTTSSSPAHAAALKALWDQGNRSAAVAEQLAVYVQLTYPSRHEAFRSPEARAFLEAGIEADPLSLSLRYRLHVRVDGDDEDPETARAVLPFLDCHTWSRGTTGIDAIESALGLNAAFHPAVFGQREALARRFSLDGRRTAIDVESEPERAMRLAVDWAFDTDRTDAELVHLLRPLANRTSEPVWLRLCDFRS